MHFFTFFQLFLSSLVLQFFNLFIEMPSMNRNEKAANLDCGREYTRKDASRHRKTCGVLKCWNSNFYTCSSDELTNHFKMKHCQHNDKFCARQSQKTLQEEIKLIFFIKNIEITMNIN